MATIKEGDKVKIATRAVTPEDRKLGRYYEHMAGLVGTVENAYADNSFAVSIDKSSLTEVSLTVHETAVQRMRQKFADSLGEEARKMLTPEEVNFDAHFMHLVQINDLQLIS